MNHNHIPTAKTIDFHAIEQPYKKNHIFTNIDEFAQFLQFSTKNYNNFKELYKSNTFRLKVPYGYASKISKNNLNDPLLLQVLPTFSEHVTYSNYSIDPLKESETNPISSLIHKYDSRVLITVTGACSIHCRYCFRKHFPYSENILNDQNWHQITEYINNHPDINEVILSGGDPLTLTNTKLFKILSHIENIKQVDTIRIHSRHAVTQVERFDDEFLKRLQESRCYVILVTHTNHANEIGSFEIEKFQYIKSYDIHLLNQTVLLKNVNDNAVTLTELSRQLFKAGIMPYYLHLLDKVQGAQQFDIEKNTALILYKELLKKLPGYLVPKLVYETHSEPNKVPISPY